MESAKKNLMSKVALVMCALAETIAVCDIRHNIIS
jgi:hypothetical protein